MLSLFILTNECCPCYFMDMPKKPGHPCKQAGCNEVIPSGTTYCTEHKKKSRKISDSKRGSASSRGYGARWKRVRLAYLQRHPLCAICYRQGITRCASVVDHITPHKGDAKLMWDEKNFQSLCVTCHNHKTAKQDGGLGNATQGRG